ncbi:MAG: L-lactate permease [Gudongella sp.]|nr:L-lactate permease [Gudongella sp.]
MNMEFSFQLWLVSALPILLLLLFMVGLKWSALKAAPVSLLVTLLTATFVFKATPELILIEAGKSIWSSLSIISVVITAILLYETSKEAKAFDTLNKAFSASAPNELLRILLIGVVFSSFLQGVTGFGVPILVTAPLLIGIGVSPMWAVVVPLIGHCWAGTFGTLALAWHALILQTDLVSTVWVALYASVLLSILNLSAGITISWFYGGIKAIRKGLLAILAISITQGFGQILVTQINPDLGVFVPSAASAGVLILVSRIKMYRDEWSIENSRIMVYSPTGEGVKNSNGMSFFQAFFPYVAMTLITLSVLMISPINSFFGSLSYGPSFPGTVTGIGVHIDPVDLYAPIKPFTHASFFLALSALMGYVFYQKRSFVRTGSISLIISRALRKALPSSIAILSLMGISRIMTGSGQTEILSYGVASLFGNLYAGISPFVGLVGAFITSSNMSSNILFGGFQYSLSGILNVESFLLLGAQTAGGSIGTSIAPSNVVLGATTAGILGKEGDILRKIIPFTIAVTSMFGITTLVLTLYL